MPAYDEKPIEDKVKEFNGVVNAVFSNDTVPREGRYHFCIACISIDYLVKIGKKELSSSLFRKVEVEIVKKCQDL